MEMGKKQQKALLRMFVAQFQGAPEEERKDIYYEFAHNFSEFIDGWWLTIRDALIKSGVDGELVKQWEAMESARDLEVKKTAAEVYTIDKLAIEDEKQVNNILVHELGVEPRLSEFSEIGTVKDYMATGFSFVAKKGREIVGVILAQKIMEYGSYYIWLDDFAITEDEQGNGLGRLMIEHLMNLAWDDDVNVVRLGTKKNRKAYEIYRHWGFEEQNEETVYLKKYFFRSQSK